MMSYSFGVGGGGYFLQFTGGFKTQLLKMSLTNQAHNMNTQLSRWLSKVEMTER